MFKDTGQNHRQLIADLDFSIGKEVVISGFLRECRNCGQLVFLKISDISGCIQVIFKNTKTIGIETDGITTFPNIKKESVLVIKGTLAKKQSDKNPEPFAEGEIVCSEGHILSEALLDSPFPLNNLSDTSSESLRLQHRYLDLRKEANRSNLIYRHKIKHVIYNYFVDNGFIEINTPSLSVPSREGAKTFNTSLLINNEVYEFALAQSPQLYKQLLMVSGFERYFQFNVSFRNEDLRSDRQYEFTQLDMELSYVKREYLFKHIEGLMHLINERVFSNTKDLSFTYMTYADAMSKYGCDKPDIRYDLMFEKLNEEAYTSIDKDVEVYAIRFISKEKISLEINQDKFALLSSDLDVLEYAKTSNLSLKLDLKPDEQVLVLKTYKETKEQDLLSLSELRRELAQQLKLIDPDKWAFVWIVEGPLFIYNNIAKEYQIAHHLFTKPQHDSVEVDKEVDKSCGYDLVLNGLEIASGSQRINNKETQLNMFKVAGLSDEEIEDNFGGFLRAFDYGVPPHLGLAIGLERFVQLVLNTESIRDVIAFPKNNHGFCKLTNCPKRVNS